MRTFPRSIKEIQRPVPPFLASNRHRQDMPILSHDTVALGRWRAWRRSVATTVRWLWLLKLDAVLLLVVALIGAVAVVAVVRGLGRVRWCGLLVLVAVVRLPVVVVHGSRSPACAIEGLTSGLAPSACCEAAAGDENEEEANDNDRKDYPAYPAVPGASSTVVVPSTVLVVTSGHGVLVVW